MFIDTHAHLYLEQFDQDIEDILKNAKNKDVTKIFLPNIEKSTFKSLIDLCNRFPNICYPMAGLHPCSVNESYKEELQFVVDKIKNIKVFGVGETGIDLYWDTSFKKQQIEAFEFQISLAKKYDLPIIIHSRESLDLTIELINNQQDGTLKGIFHCFNGNIKQSEKIQELNFLMGLGGVVTYKNAKMEDVIGAMPLNVFVLETDAPYLSPVPFRGKRNESSYIYYVAEKISEIKNLDISVIEENTTRNAKQLFGIEE